MVVTINMSIPESCASCPLSVRHFGKLYCPPLDGRVGNEGKDERCPLVDACDQFAEVSKKASSVTINGTADEIKVTNCNDNDLISRQDALSCFHDWIDRRGDVHTADEMPEYQRIEQLPTAQSDVIRCKDCRFQDKGRNESESWNLCGYRPWLHVPTEDEHYCGYAERRTDE